jgi:DNA-binding GntR family transcriptional regulator
MSNAARPSLIEIRPESIRPTALPDQVYALLKEGILTCRFGPEERLVELKLTETLKVSRTPIREALNRLAHDGLVTIHPNSGFRVAPITIAEFKNLTEFRAVVEPEGAALAAERATPAEVAEMRRLATLSFDPNDDRHFAEYCRANAAFHLAVARAAANPMLEHAIMSALDMSQRPAYLRIGRQLDAAIPTEKHHEIVNAIEQHNATSARDLMRRHVLGSGNRIIEALVAAGYK